MGCTCVTISHRPALVAFHDLVLALDGEGGWSVHRGVNSEQDGEDDSLSGNAFHALPFIHDVLRREIIEHQLCLGVQLCTRKTCGFK